VTFSISPSDLVSLSSPTNASLPPLAPAPCFLISFRDLRGRLHTSIEQGVFLSSYLFFFSLVFLVQSFLRFSSPFFSPRSHELDAPSMLLPGKDDVYIPLLSLLFERFRFFPSQIASVSSYPPAEGCPLDHSPIPSSELILLSPLVFVSLAILFPIIPFSRGLEYLCFVTPSPLIRPARLAELHFPLDPFLDPITSSLAGNFLRTFRVRVLTPFQISFFSPQPSVRSLPDPPRTSTGRPSKGMIEAPEIIPSRIGPPFPSGPFGQRG